MPQQHTQTTDRFFALFHRDAATAEAGGGSAEQRRDAAASMLELGRVRAAGQLLIRARLSPDRRRDGPAAKAVLEIVNDDMPYLVRSATAALRRGGHTVLNVVHPVLRTRRDAAGALLEICDAAPGSADASAAPSAALSAVDARPESFMRIEFALSRDDADLAAVAEDAAEALRHVRAAFEDAAAMRDRRRRAATALREAGAGPVNASPANASPAPASPANAGLVAETAEADALLSWLDDEHFILLGRREYRFTRDGGDVTVSSDGGMGVLRDDEATALEGLRRAEGPPPDVRRFIDAPQALMMTKTGLTSRVVDNRAMDAVLVKRFDADGRATGGELFVGLLTPAAYARSPREIPFLRRKTAGVLNAAGFDPHSHNGKTLAHILETFPRDELFAADEAELRRIALGMLNLREDKTALFVRRDPFDRFASCLVFAPRDRLDADFRRRALRLLEEACGGETTSVSIRLEDGGPALLHATVKAAGVLPPIDAAALEAKLAEAARDWRDRLGDALAEKFDDETAAALARAYRDAFPPAYRERTSPRAAVEDAAMIEALGRAGRPTVGLRRPVHAPPGEARFRICRAGGPAVLADVLPMLERLGLRAAAETTYEVAPAHRGEIVWLHDFTVQCDVPEALDDPGVLAAVADVFSAVWDGRTENDGFNRLALRCGLNRREITLLRACAKYMRQARFVFGQDAVEEALAANPTPTRRLIRYFHALFDPNAQGAETAAQDAAAIRADLLNDLDAVSSLDSDRILRAFLNLIDAALRTNFYQTDAGGAPKDHLSLKLDSRAIDGLPAPRPLIETFVYSPRVEGVHLRGGKTARGGIRWSDRREDFRTEVLGLVKAQMVKNAVIVPAGSKGGFVVKRPPPAAAGQEAARAEGVECYKIFIRGLLDVVDNLDDDGRVAPPPATVRRDGDDPYLVVAADKGTATFSDVANGTAAEYGFWLGDAFASGGSRGYDHKKMGVTARGAWECVKRHFREIGVDVQTQDFTVAGVGDMSGDVFGNGMLLSKRIRLVAAFDHRHVFIDPNPDAATSWAERKRLFDLPRSSWADYDPAALSPGGRIYDRSAKHLVLTPEIRAALGVDAERSTPADLIRAVLKADVDLLWLGGVGAYVKASAETHADVGDKSNDPVRVDAADLRCKVAGEGANLGFTQNARIEAGAKGVRLNTDAIDNSAGVATSDQEVNVKILLDDAVRRGAMTPVRRNRLLTDMTDDVAVRALTDNYRQSAVLTLLQTDGAGGFDAAVRLMRRLEKAGRLDRAVERLPDDETAAARRRAGFGPTRPELAVLLAYAKLELRDALLTADLSDEPFADAALHDYFPDALRREAPEAVRRHRLRREIVAARLSNEIVNRVGPYFIGDVAENTGCTVADAVRAYVAARDVFDLPALWREIDALDGAAPASFQPAIQTAIAQTAIAQTAATAETVRLATRAANWMLTNLPRPLNVSAIVDRFRAGAATLAATLDAALDDDGKARLAARTRALTDLGAPADLARRVAAAPTLEAALDLSCMAENTGRPVTRAAAVYFRLGDRFGLDWLREKAAALPGDDVWVKRAADGLIDDLFACQRRLTGEALKAENAAAAENATRTTELESLLTELRRQPTIDLAMLAVADRRLRNLSAA